MLFIDELRKKRTQLKLRASAKEKWLASYLCDEQCPELDEREVTDTEKICAAAFCGNEDDLSNSTSSIIQQHRRRDSKRTSHYSNHLIDLCAFAQLDFEAEKNNLERYCATHPPQARFIIQELFGDSVCLANQDKEDISSGVHSDLDRLALHLVDGDLSRITQESLLGGLEQSESLLDHYIVETAYLRSISFADTGQYLNDARQSAQILQDAVSTVRRVFRALVRIVAVVPIVLLIYLRICVSSSPYSEIVDVAGLVIPAFLILLGFIKGPRELVLEKTSHAGDYVAHCALRLVGVDDTYIDDLASRYNADPLAEKVSEVRELSKK
ncbi:hypothetical protein CRI94_11150 [Longibacter salinarum]|uniref:Uncharacterized protein n=1 Tax=Longibacter salinarum TaxID=1850348 RepID=A0A2A8CX52_9BACT|nr:hypothetical protein [Longibacter salinarum]PEN13191.1 hypothetical protein CRI94_11150 [Longibacter salinarum]